MGHQRIGRLPKTVRWRRVVSLLAGAGTGSVEDWLAEGIDDVAEATVDAAERRLRQLANDPCINYGFYLLVQLASASQTDEFPARLRALGIPVQDDDSALSFIARAADHLREEFAQHPESGPFAELTALAVRRALTETIGQQTGSLFGSSIQDVQRAVRQFATASGFGQLAQRFFGDLMARTLRFFVDREVANSMGRGRRLQTSADVAAFTDALETYCRQSARILEQFAPEWLSLHQWQSAGNISRQEAQGFTAYALQKLRRELAPEYR
jgi:hypothetical protein